MTINQLKSGSYRIRKMVNGVNYSVVVDHKPKVREAEVLIEDKIRQSIGSSKSMKGSFEDSYSSYRESHSNVLSISTLRGYDSIMRNLSWGFKAMPVALIDSAKVQAEINLYSEGRSPKTVKSALSLIMCVMKYAREDITLKVITPPKKLTKKYLPSEEDVRKLLEYVKGTEYEPPILLATYGLRQSEICALKVTDFRDQKCVVSKAKVYKGDGFVVQDRTKETYSTREVPLPAEVIECILSNEKVKQTGEIYAGHPNNMTKMMGRFCKEQGIPHFTLHSLRHFYASLSHSLGIPNKYIMLNGGWKSESTLTRVYQDAMQEKAEEMQDIFSARLKGIRKAED